MTSNHRVTLYRCCEIVDLKLWKSLHDPLISAEISDSYPHFLNLCLQLIYPFILLLQLFLQDSGPVFIILLVSLLQAGDDVQEICQMICGGGWVHRRQYVTLPVCN